MNIRSHYFLIKSFLTQSTCAPRDLNIKKISEGGHIWFTIWGTVMVGAEGVRNFLKTLNFLIWFSFFFKNTDASLILIREREIRDNINKVFIRTFCWTYKIYKRFSSCVFLVSFAVMDISNNRFKFVNKRAGYRNYLRVGLGSLSQVVRRHGWTLSR